ncbi:retrovirus-related pol polyprotein from transposon TNT 1-94 [Tanacetum coccineum]
MHHHQNLTSTADLMQQLQIKVKEIPKHNLQPHLSLLLKIDSDHEHKISKDKRNGKKNLALIANDCFGNHKVTNDWCWGREHCRLSREAKRVIKGTKVSQRKMLAVQYEAGSCLMPLALKTQNDSFAFVHELKQEMHANLKYVESLEKEVDKLEYDKAEFSNMYDMLLQECVSNDVMCSYLHSLSDLDAHTELQCLYLHKVKECECLAQKLSKQTEYVSKEVYIELLRSFAKLEKHSISLELALQQCQEQMKNNAVCKEKASNIFQKEREQYFEIQDLKAQLQEKNIALRVTHRTNVSRPPPRSNQTKDKVVPNTSQVKFRKTEVEDRHRISSISNKTKSVIACNDSLKCKNSNVNVVCATCGKCVFNLNHDSCVYKFLNDVNARTKKPDVVPISTRKPKSQTNKSVATPLRKQLHLIPLLQNPRVTIVCYMRKQVRHGNGGKNNNVHQDINRLFNSSYFILFIVDSGCTKHMTANISNLCNFVEKYMGTVHFGNDQFAPILGYRDLVQGNIIINKVYYVEGLNHNLFLVGQFCDAETASSTLICLMAKASPTQAWLWHRRIFHLNFDYINLILKKYVVIGLPKLKYVKDQLCFSCKVIKAKRSSFKTKIVPSSKGRLNLLYMDLYGPMRVASINGKKYILAEAIATEFYTQNISIIILTHEKMAYHIIYDRKPSIKHLHIFCCTCYLTRDGENLDRMKEKGDPCIWVGYSTQSKGYRVYNKRTRLIVESIHLKFDEIKEMSETYVANDTSDLVPQRQKASYYDNSDPVPQQQNVSPSADTIAPYKQD